MRSIKDKEWALESHGGTWSITTKDGDVVADDIPHGETANYIVSNHHRDLRERHGFRKSTHFDTQPARKNPAGKQCSAVCPPYRCTQDHGHTGPHYTYGMDAVYVFDTSV